MSGVPAIERLLDSVVATRQPGNKRKQRVAQSHSLREIQRAATVRRSERSEDPRLDELNPRQRDLIDILRAAPKPLSTGRIKRVAEGFPSLRRALEANSVHKSLTYLEKRGLIESVETTRTGNWRGRKINLWWPAEENLSPATSESDAARLREIQVLIEAQEEEARSRFASESGHSGDRSLDAPITEDGFTILDTLGAEDENFAELAA